MHLSIENRHRLCLLCFAAADILLWDGCGLNDAVAAPYVALAWCMRLAMLGGLGWSFRSPQVGEKCVLLVLTWCVAMFILNVYGMRSYTIYNTPTLNLLGFKADALVPVEHGMEATFLYANMLACAYFFAAKYIRPEILQQK